MKERSQDYLRYTDAYQQLKDQMAEIRILEAVDPRYVTGEVFNQNEILIDRGWIEAKRLIELIMNYRGLLDEPTNKDVKLENN